MIVKYNAWADGRDTISAGRVFEHTEDHLVAQFKPNGHLDFPSLVALPTLFVQESSGQGNEVARVGTITRARLSGSNVMLDYAYDLGIPGIPNRVLQGLAGDLDIDDFQFSRTHWSVKDTDLFRVLVRGAQPKRQKPTVFILPDHENIEPTLVSAMMPFHPGFDRVYEALQAVAGEVGASVAGGRTTYGRTQRSCRMWCHSLIDRVWSSPTAPEEIRMSSTKSESLTRSGER